MFKIATTLAVALILGNLSLASSDDLPPSIYTPSINQIIVKQAEVYGVPVPLMKAVIACESGYDIKAHHLVPTGPNRENSYGLSQINLFAHPDITEEQAEDPEFAISYLASHLSTNPNMWLICSHAKIK